MNSNILEKLTTIVRDAIAGLKVRSALNPALWLCAIAYIPSIICAVITHGTIQILFMIYAAFPVVVCAFGFIYFMLKSPEKLQSENYQLRQQALELIAEKGGRITVASTSVEAITNPELPQLPSPVRTSEESI